MLRDAGRITRAVLPWHRCLLGSFVAVATGILVLSPWSGISAPEHDTYVGVYLTAQSLLAGATILGRRRNRSAGRRAWTMVSAAAVVSVIDDAAWALLSDNLGYGVAGIGLAARIGVQIVAGVLVLACPVLLLRARLGGRTDREGLVDGLAIASAIGLVLWETLLLWGPGGEAHVIDDANVTLFMALTGLLSACVALLARLAFTGVHREPSARLLLLAASVHAVAIVSLGSAGAPPLGVFWPAELTSVLSFGLLAAATLHPSAERLTDEVDIDALGARVSLARLATLTAALAVPAVVTTVRTWWLADRTDAIAPGAASLGLLGSPASLLPSSIAALVITISVIWRMWQLMQEREHAREELRHRATHDDLTGLPNRRVLHDLLVARLRADPHERHTAPFAVLFIDLDGFKAINDTLGHQAGDRVLIEVGARVKAALRTDDILVRMAGDEFVAVFRGPLDQDVARTMADRLHQEIVEPIDIHGMDVVVSASIGVALSQAPTGDFVKDAEALLRMADHAMYDAKRAGGGQTVVASLSQHPTRPPVDATTLVIRHEAGRLTSTQRTAR
jgi:diguanylate cyclase (GGDEF)-like protein